MYLQGILREDRVTRESCIGRKISENGVTSIKKSYVFIFCTPISFCGVAEVVLATVVLTTAVLTIVVLTSVGPGLRRMGGKSGGGGRFGAAQEKRSTGVVAFAARADVASW